MSDVLYKCGTARIHKHYAEGEKIPKRIKTPGGTAKLVEFDTPEGRRPVQWPMLLENMAVLPQQVAEANESCAKMGLRTRYEADGMCHVPDAGALKAHMKALDFIDRRSYD